MSELTNKQKFEQHESFLQRLRNGTIYRLGLSIQAIEDMKYSDDKDLRKAAAIIEYAKEMETNNHIRFPVTEDVKGICK